MRTITITFAIVALLGNVGCLSNRWNTESYFDEHTFAAADAATAQKDANRIIGFIPTLGFKQEEPLRDSTPQTEAVFIRHDNDHFHITIRVRSLLRLDQPGFVTKVRIESYNVGEEGAIAAGKSILNEIDQLYRQGG
jgi:hypothetical protein